MQCPSTTSSVIVFKPPVVSALLAFKPSCGTSRRCHVTQVSKITESQVGAIASPLTFRSQRVACRTAMMSSPEVAPALKSSGYADSVVMQAFGWDSCEKGNWYKHIQSKIPEIVACHVTHLWLPPPSQSVSPQGYMPGQLYNLNSKFGTKDDLINLNRALLEAGIKPMADIVINHRCADEQVDGVWNKYRDDVTHDGRKIDWGKWAITSNDPNFEGTGNPDTGDDYGPAPDLDHLNPDLREALKDWMTWLMKDIGFKSWRLDFARGYGAQFVNEYISATTTADELNMGEYWTDLKWEGSTLASNQDEARQKLINWINATGKTCCGIDFPTKGILQEAVKHSQYWRLRDSQGKAPGGIGWMPSRMVTFIDNHDTGSTQKHWPFPSGDIAQGYAYILTHPGMPCLFWDHLFTWGPDVRKTIIKLIELRKRNGINACSKLEILCAESDMYVARIDDRVTIKMGPRGDMGKFVPNKAEGWGRSSVNGKNFAVWEKTTL